MIRFQPARFQYIPKQKIERGIIKLKESATKALTQTKSAEDIGGNYLQTKFVQNGKKPFWGVIVSHDGATRKWFGTYDGPILNKTQKSFK